MAAVLMLIRVQRAALRSWVSLALLLAVVGGGVLAAGAGARRTDTAYPRFLADSNSADVLVNASPNDPTMDNTPLLEKIAKLPQVAQAGIGYFVLGGVSLPSGRRVDENDVSLIAVPDARYGTSIDHFKVLDGRLADPARVDEATISFPFADNAKFKVHVGDALTIRLLSPQDVRALLATAGASSPDIFGAAHGAVVHVRVAGVMASPLGTDFPPLPPHVGASVYLTPAFLHRYRSSMLSFGGEPVKLRHGTADLAAFEAAAEQLGADAQVPVSSQAIGVHEAVVQDTLHLQAVGVGVLAGLAAAVLLLVLGQGVARRVALEATDHTALRALGASRGQLWATSMVRAALAGLAGAIGAVILAVALSPLTPIGNARLAEPDPGLDVDVAIVLGGAAALWLVVVVIAALPAWRAATAPGGDASAAQAGSRLAAALSRAGFPATAVSGVRLALEPGRGRNAAPVRSAILACVVAAATVAGALAFSASLGHLLDTPRLYGWNWDAEVNGLIDPTHAPDILAKMPAVAAFAQGTTGDVGIDDDRAGALAMSPGKGSVGPVVLSGRVPAKDDEIMLGSQTDPGVAIGRQVRVHVGDASVRLRVVGRGVLPILSDTSHLGTGAWLTFGALHRLLGNSPNVVMDTFLVRYTGDPHAAAKLVSTFGADGVSGSAEPSGLIGFGDLSALPLVLGGVLAAGAVATLTHAVATSVRRRRRELAILKTLGFVRGQVALTVAWQTTTIAVVALLVGVPVGAAAGRWAWALFAGQQGMVSDPVVPVLSMLLLLPAAVLLANLVAAIPGRFAARTSPAIVLRAE